ncbi:NAD(P)/FAD-dependent oxidoreductase [Parasphaerochaeta coccoides]|uniref:HI0933 family protein n=1 Tax=Parasphaerochaeta coccoides (strain ATCC BAA-1237 / DSM 17374 / SPN1) TaxID=760011 RepID=F4GJK7_PARC1|nr:aminoacetone oxidase family FAD-binding enzyme [Parasphaerochaeta coccoides]AEC02754.1 HI0933 family protein [Parasphaerochaeta coccoides DSM 17374]
MYDVIIAGAGAAGLFLAASLPSSLSVLVMDKNPVPGRKIMITGGGMCNLSNTDAPEDFLKHFGSRQQANFLKPALRSFPPHAAWDWFRSHGLELFFRDDGKVYPASFKAQSVVDVLMKTALAQGVEFAFSCTARKVLRHDGFFTVVTDTGEKQTRTIVLATGGMSYPRTGSDGSGYLLAKSLGHSIVPPSPALTSLIVENYGFTAAAGTSVQDASIRVFHAGENKAWFKAQGDVLFTHDGLSGPAILTMSRWCHHGDIVRISLIGNLSREEACTMLMDTFGQSPHRQVSTVLKEAGLTSTLVSLVMTMSGAAPSLRCADMNREMRSRLIQAVTDASFPIEGRKGFSSAMVTSGGIRLDDVDRSSMESRLVPGVFFVGEILDIDGDTGGYNMQAAFSMARLCACSLVERHVTGS